MEATSLLYRRACVELHERYTSAHEEKDPQQAMHCYDYSFAYLNYLVSGGALPAGHISLEEEDRYHCRRAVDGMLCLPPIMCEICDQDDNN